MQRRVRSLSLPALEMLAVMLRDPGTEYYGLDLAERIGRPTGTVYPLLRKFEKLDVLTCSPEDVDPSVEKRPRRQLYRFTGQGEKWAREQVHLIQSSPAFQGNPPSQLTQN